MNDTGGGAARHPSASHEPWRAAGLRKGRRYGVSHAAIERATERRLAGDWRGACAAAGVDVDLDLDALRGEYGAEFVAGLLDDLHHLVPDLARLHLPRSWKGLGLILPGQGALLSRPGGPDGPWLSLEVKPWYERRSRRPLLGVGREWLVPSYGVSPTGHAFGSRCNVSAQTGHWEGVPHMWETSRHLWDIRFVDGTRERWGGNSERVPFLNSDGRPRTVDELPVSEPADPVGWAEWIDVLHQTGRVGEAFAAAGIEFDPGPVLVEAAARLPFSPARLPDELQRLAAAGLGDCFQIPYSSNHRMVLSLDAGTVRAEFAAFDIETSPEMPVLPEVCWARPPDIDVLRDGMSPDELHPLVREAIAPDHVPGVPPEPAFLDRGPVRVRCQGEWHTVAPGAGGLEIPHGEAEQTREESLRALGGSSGGCFAVQEAWKTGGGWLPRELRRRRDDLFEHVRHGDTDAVLTYLETGGDPRVRNAGGQTLVHFLALLDQEVLLPRLLAAGADVNAEDLQGRNVLDHIGRRNASPALLEALLGTGAEATDGAVSWPDWDDSPWA